MNNKDYDATGVSRSKIFCSLIMKDGEIKRGVLVNRMRVSEQTFAREYMSFLDQYPVIKYNRKTRVFTYEP